VGHDFSVEGRDCSAVGKWRVRRSQGRLWRSRHGCRGTERRRDDRSEAGSSALLNSPKLASYYIRKNDRKMRDIGRCLLTGGVVVGEGTTTQGAQLCGFLFGFHPLFTVLTMSVNRAQSCWDGTDHNIPARAFDHVVTATCSSSSEIYVISMWGYSSVASTFEGRRRHNETPTSRPSLTSLFRHV